MRTMNVIILASGLISPLVPCFAATIIVGEVEINVPDPAGLTSASELGPQVAATFNSNTLPEHRLVAAYISREDIEKTARNPIEDNLVLRRASITINRRIESEIIDIEDFRTFKQLLKTPAASLIDEGYNEKQSDPPTLSEQRHQIDVEKPELMGVFDESPTSISIMTSLESEGIVRGERKHFVELYSQTTIFVRGKMLFLYIFTPIPINDKSIIAWVKASTISWRHAIQEAN